jgi:hypothetical protein
MKRIEYQGIESFVYEKGNIKIVVSVGVGPRILFLGFKDGENLFADLPDVEIKSGLGVWKIYGGHRLWHSPEAMPRSYAPDNSPVEISERANRIIMQAQAEPGTGIAKRMEIEFTSQNSLKVYHYLKNTNLWEVELAAWALSVMGERGVVIIPQNKKLSGPDNLLPNRILVLWPYTKVNDKRLILGDEHIILKQDKDSKVPIKIGANVTDGWCAYYRDRVLFIKKFSFFGERQYPDFGCNVESYTNDRMIELETLGPLIRLKPQEELEHIEEWELVKGLSISFEEGKLRGLSKELVKV